MDFVKNTEARLHAARKTGARTLEETCPMQASETARSELKGLEGLEVVQHLASKEVLCFSATS